MCSVLRFQIEDLSDAFKVYTQYATAAVSVSMTVGRYTSHYKSSVT